MREAIKIMENKLILWDIDGTLMFCGSDGTQALNTTINKLYGIEDAFERAGIGQAMDATILSRIISHFGIVDADLTQILSDYAGHLAEVLRKNPDKRVLPGILNLLESIEAHPSLYNGILTSNFKLGAHTKLESVGLLDYFKIGGYGDSPGEKWDAALIGLGEAEQHYGLIFKPEQVFIIGDSQYDIACARRLGMKSIAVATGWTDYDTLAAANPDYLFHDLSDYKRILDLFEETRP